MALNTIILWCHPRSTSTMFERAFLNRPDTFEVLHEPLGDAWYFGPNRVSPRYTPERCEKEYPHYKESTTAKTWAEIVKHTDKPRTFVKDMAQYICVPPTTASTAPPLPEKGNPTYIPSKDLFAPGIVHTFLIRTPEKAVPSYYKLCTGENCAITGFDYFSPEEVGLSELKVLYEYITSQSGGKKPILIDSKDLLERPEEYMKAYCEEVQVEYTPEMLQWSSGSQQHFDKWKGFHTDAENSTGIRKPKPASASEIQSYPEEVQQAIKDNMDAYNWLHERRLQL